MVTTKQLKLLRLKDDRLNRDLLQAQKNLSSASERYKTSRKDETIKKNGSNWVANWKCLPSEVMAEYQDSKEQFYDSKKKYSCINYIKKLDLWICIQ